MKHRLEIWRNAEGAILAYMSPVGADNKVRFGYRIAGPKGWGGTVLLESMDIKEEDLARYVREYAPGVLEEQFRGMWKPLS